MSKKQNSNLNLDLFARLIIIIGIQHGSFVGLNSRFKLIKEVFFEKKTDMKSV